jgi:N-acetyl-anhydromuramyl-L-alanine amidase AmpD
MDIIKYGEFTPTGKQKKKNQIILVHTSRNVGDYLQSLKYRNNGNYKKIPNYIVDRTGKVLQLLGNNEHTNYFEEPNINRNSVIISLENLGWLQKEPLKDYYINWIGNIYKGVVYEKKWRDYYFWQPYTEIQLEKTTELCKMLFREIGIPKNFIGHNTKINGVEKFEGLVTKSNYYSENTDLSPAFNFDNFLKKIENE